MTNDKIKVLEMFDLNNVYQPQCVRTGFVTSAPIPEDKFEAIKKAIEFVINQDPKESNTSTKEEVGWEIVLGGSSLIDKHPWFPDNSHGGQSCMQMGCEIISVRRKSDGVVFSVGDEIDFRMLGGYFSAAIDRFEIDTFDSKEITAYHGAFGIGYQRWRKLPPNKPDYNRRLDYLEDKVAYIEKKLNIEG